MELQSSCSSLAASHRGVPTCPLGCSRDQRGSRIFFWVGTRTQHTLRGEAPHNEIAKEEEEEEKVRELLTFSHPAVLLLVHEPQY